MINSERITKDNFVVICLSCQVPVYEYVGVKPIPPTQELKSADFRGLGRVASPELGQAALCPFCASFLFEDKYI